LDNPAYTPYYCEENVWYLAGDTRLPRGDHLVILISNTRRICPLWAQRAAIAVNEPVYWDYHVILAARGENGAIVYDLDSTLPFPTPWKVYALRTFRPDLRIRGEYLPKFRVIPATEYRARFSSDRRHMKRPGGAWAAPPPPWPAIQGAESAITLQAALDLSRRDAGELYDLEELDALLAPRALQA
jgi:hypothetical protein